MLVPGPATHSEDRVTTRNVRITIGTHPTLTAANRLSAKGSFVVTPRVTSVMAATIVDEIAAVGFPGRN